LIARAEGVQRALAGEVGGHNGAALLAAQLAELSGSTARAIELYRRAHDGFIEVDTHLMAWTCRLRLAELTGDATLASSARDAATAAGITNPDRVFAMLAPIRASE
jgi:hypothetical protein